MPTYLPHPTHTFAIPSVYDGIQLACRVYLPQELGNTNNVSRWRARGAIVAHPYAPLGGCNDDPVVSFIGRELLDAGYVVGTFNFRGAGGSKGRTSWTANPELADYVSFYGFMVLYLHILGIKLSQKSDEDHIFREGRYDTSRETASPHIILGGYSYGSLVASNLPEISVIVDLFKSSTDGTPLHEIFLTANTVCAWSENTISAQMVSLSSHAHWSIGQTLNDLTATISYLLVSPLLPPVNLFLTLFSNPSLEVGISSGGERKRIACPKPTDVLCAYRTLALYGDQDTFTSVTKLRKWSDKLANTPQSRFLSAEIEGAGHFWREDGAESQAKEFLRQWLHQQA